MNDVDEIKDNSEDLYGAKDEVETMPAPSFQAALEESQEPEPPPNIRPNGDFVLIRRLAEDEKTAGGLFIPKEMKRSLFRAEVISMGIGMPADGGGFIPAADCKKGDIVLVCEDPPLDDPRFAHATRYLIPVSPLGDKSYLLCPGVKVYAIEIPDDEGHLVAEPQPQ